jgi:hypothetical protein
MDWDRVVSCVAVKGGCRVKEKQGDGTLGVTAIEVPAWLHAALIEVPRHVQHLKTMQPLYIHAPVHGAVAGLAAPDPRDPHQRDFHQRPLEQRQRDVYSRPGLHVYAPVAHIVRH